MIKRDPIPKGKLCKGCDRFEEARCAPSHMAPGNSADILFIDDQPDEKSAVNNKAFSGHGGKIVNTAITMLKRDDRFSPLNHRLTYAVQCMSPDDTAPNKAVVAQCSTYLDTLLLSSPPKMIIAMGATVMRRLGLKLKHKDARGKFYKHPKFGIPILVTFSGKALLANAGLFETFKRDLFNGFNKAIIGEQEALPIEVIAEKYGLPKGVDEAIAICDEIVDYCEKGDPASWSISVDTETTTLYPEKDSAKIIAFCFGWGKGRAATILYDHPHAGDAYLDRLPEVHAAVDRVLGTFKPKIFHNAKFDLKFLELKYGFTVRNVIWDTLLGEHLLDEDKKGNYGLKALTAGWLPDYCGYEDKLYDILNAEGGSLVEATDKEIADIEDIIKEDYPEYLNELRKYRQEVAEYVVAKAKHDIDMAAYVVAIDEYNYIKGYLAGMQAAWKVEVADWPKGKKGKPKKPVKWFTKPKKPKAIKAPKKPKDPRTKKEKQISQDAGFETVPLDDLQIYGAVDADVTRLLAQIQLQRIRGEKSRVASLMKSHAIPASRTLGRMEFEGTKVDLGYMAKLDDGLGKIVLQTETEVYGMAGRKQASGANLNLNHAGTLANVLFSWGWTHPDGTQMRPYDILERTKTGQPSTAEKNLRPFVEYEDDDKEIPTKEALFIERLLRWRKASKAHGTFLANVRALSRRDGFLHTQFHLNGTGTGRLSSSDMNMQNIPKYLAGWNIKKLFIPDSEDYVIVNVDYKGAEVRVFTAYAKDDALIKALNEGLDMHSFFAHKVFNKPYEWYADRDNPSVVPDPKLSKQLDIERSRIKRVVFGILYGAGPHKISESINGTIDEAKALIGMLYRMFPAIADYATDVENEVRKNGYVETHFHRRRRFPLGKISRHRGRANRQARNFKIQSTSSDIVVGQIVEMDQPLRDLGGRMLLTVHDSMVFQYPKAKLNELEPFVLHYAEERVKQKYPWLPVPFKVDIEVGPNYGEVQPLAKYLAKNPFTPLQEGIIEENELLNELREDAFVAV